MNIYNVCQIQKISDFDQSQRVDLSQCSLECYMIVLSLTLLFLLSVSFVRPLNLYVSNKSNPRKKSHFILQLFTRRKPGETKLVFDKVKSQLNVIRSKPFPKQPKIEKNDGRLEIHQKYQKLLDRRDIREEFGTTLDKRHKLYFGSVVKKLFAFHVFVSFAAIDFIKNHITKEQHQKRRYLIDGTFKIVPRKFNQLLIIAIEIQNDVRNNQLFFFKNEFKPNP